MMLKLSTFILSSPISRKSLLFGIAGSRSLRCSSVSYEYVADVRLRSYGIHALYTRVDHLHGHIPTTKDFRWYCPPLPHFKELTTPTFSLTVYLVRALSVPGFVVEALIPSWCDRIHGSCYCRHPLLANHQTHL